MCRKACSTASARTSRRGLACETFAPTWYLPVDRASFSQAAASVDSILNSAEVNARQFTKWPPQWVVYVGLGSCREVESGPQEKEAPGLAGGCACSLMHAPRVYACHHSATGLCQVLDLERGRFCEIAILFFEHLFT